MTDIKQAPSLKRQLQLTIEVKEVKNVYQVYFPTNRQLMDIESLKDAQSNGRYASMSTNSTLLGNYTLDTIDMIAYFTVLIPDLCKDIKVQTLADLDAYDSKVLLDVYRNDFFPWFKEWLGLMGIIRDPKLNETAEKAQKPANEANPTI